MRHLRNSKGFTLVELLVVCAIIGILVAIAIPVYSNVMASARIAKAKADARTLASAIQIYAAHAGALPTALSDLTAPVPNGLGQTAGPFIASVPAPPQGWSSSYTYTPNSPFAGMFKIEASGDGATVSTP